MATKYSARITRTIAVKITMGSLVTTGLTSGTEREIAPPTVREITYHEGAVYRMPTAKRRNAFIASINADHPGAAGAAVAA